MTQVTREEILEMLKGALDRASNGRAKFDYLEDDSRLIEDIGLSSLDLLDLRCEVENHWNMQLADEELSKMRTIGDVIGLVQGAATTGRGKSRG